MKVELERSFPVPASQEIAWAFLQDIPGVAGCMPGAKITERLDDRHFKGTVAIKVGPASMAFRGEIEVLELDANRRALHLVGRGSDTAGSSGVSMDLLARLEPGSAAHSSHLVGRSEVTMSGKAAAFGGRMMGTVADQILKQFAANFASQVQAHAAAGSVDAADSPGSPAEDAISGSPASGAASGTGSGTPPRAAPASELNAFALLWATLREWLRGLFRRKAA